MRYEAHPHPLLDLTPREQDLLLRVERGRVRADIPSLPDRDAVRHLEKLRLIEVQDVMWRPTTPRGNLVAKVLERLELARTVRRSKDAAEKKEAVLTELADAIPVLLTKIRNL